MLDRLARIARALQSLGTPLLCGAAASLLLFVSLLFLGSPDQQQRWLLPLLVGFLWTLSGWCFIANFISMPDVGASAVGRLQRLKRRLARFGYGLLALLFFLTTLAVVLLSSRLLSIWWHFSLP